MQFESRSAKSARERNESHLFCPSTGLGVCLRAASKLLTALEAFACDFVPFSIAFDIFVCSVRSRNPRERDGYVDRLAVVDGADWRRSGAKQLLAMNFRLNCCAGETSV